MPSPRTRTRLTADRLRALLDYDRKQGLLTWRVNRGRTAKRGDEAGTLKPGGAVTITIDGRTYLANRIAWMHIYGELPKGRLTAANGDLGDIRWGNILLEEELYSTTRAAAYQRERRRKQKYLAAHGDLRDFTYSDHRDPRDERNEDIYTPPGKPGPKGRKTL